MKKNAVKILLDILMSIVFVLLFNTRVLGLTFHELAGIGIGFGILVHILLNLQWVKKVTLRLFDSKLPIKTRFGYVLNVLLLLSFILIIVTGLFISKVLFPNLRLGNEGWFKTVHVSLSYLNLILLGLHIGLHWNWIAGFFKKTWHLKPSKTTGLLAKIAMIVILLFGGYQVAATNFVTEIVSLSNVFTANNFQNGHGFGESTKDFSDNSTDGSQQRMQGRRLRGGEGGSDFNHSFSEGEKDLRGQSQDTNVLNILQIILNYSGIMGLFAILTYYLEKILTRRRTIS